MSLMGEFSMRNILIAAALLFFVANSGVLGQFGKEDKPIAIPDAAPGKSQLDARPIKENVIAYHTGDGAMNEARRRPARRCRAFSNSSTPGRRAPTR